MVNCTKLLRQYKFICNDSANYSDIQLEGSTYEQLIELRNRIYNSYVDAKHCYEMREHFKYTCIDPPLWDKGHDDAIVFDRNRANRLVELLSRVNDHILSYTDETPTDLDMEEDEKINYDDDEIVESRVMKHRDDFEWAAYDEEKELRRLLDYMLDVVKRHIPDSSTSDQVRELDRIGRSYIHSRLRDMSLYEMTQLASIIESVPIEQRASSLKTYNKKDVIATIQILIMPEEVKNATWTEYPITNDIHTLEQFINNTRDVQEQISNPYVLSIRNQNYVYNKKIPIPSLVSKFGTEFIFMTFEITTKLQRLRYINQVYKLFDRVPPTPKQRSKQRGRYD